MRGRCRHFWKPSQGRSPVAIPRERWLNRWRCVFVLPPSTIAAGNCDEHSSGYKEDTVDTHLTSMSCVPSAGKLHNSGRCIQWRKQCRHEKPKFVTANGSAAPHASQARR